MKRNILLPAVLLSLALPAISGAAAGSPGETIKLLHKEKRSELRIGDPAPPIKVRWIKGQPIQRFEKGMVYVLEFWATWCGPCIKAMPHVTALAKKYTGKATVIGVSVWERGKPGQSINTLVDNFVKDMGDKMGYTVAMDLPEDYMVKSWVSATGQSSIPATIIVDKTGKIAWIGQPMDMDEPLAKIIDGTFDARAFAKQITAGQEATFNNNRKMEALQSVMKPIEASLENKNYQQALSQYQEAIQQHPDMKPFFTRYYFTALVHLDPEKAYKEAAALKDSASLMMLVIQTFATEKGLDKKFYKYAIDYYEKQPDSPFNWPASSAAYFNYGNVEKAVTQLQQFLDWAAAATAPPPAAYMEKELARLKAYKAALQK